MSTCNQAPRQRASNARAFTARGRPMDLLCAAFQREPALVDGILDRMPGAIRKIDR